MYHLILLLMFTDVCHYFNYVLNIVLRDHTCRPRKTTCTSYAENNNKYKISKLQMRSAGLGT